MKKFARGFLLAASALLLLAGCSNLSGGTVSGSGEKKPVIEIDIDGFSNYASRSARTANPTAYDNNTTFTKITLKGESESYDSFNEKDLSFGENGKAEVELTYDVWYLTLTAYMGSVPVLQGHRRVDLRNAPPASGEAITFTLTTEGVTSPGGVSLTGSVTDNDSAVKTWSAALYDLNTGAVITDTSKSDTYSDGFTYTAENVNPGRYNFRVYFMNEDGTPIGTFADIVVIAPGRTTTHAFGNLGDILLKKPNAPTALSAYYLNNSESGNYYNTLITWTRDALHNEEYFELTINDVTSGTAAAYKVFGSTVDTNNPHVREVFFESSNHVDGTLAAGSEYCIVKLPIGKKFEISIKAVNFIDASDAKERDPATAASTITLSNGNTVGANTGFGADSINRMRITYNLNGGTLLLSATAAPMTGSYVVYDTYTGSGYSHDMLTPATASNSYPQLTDGGHPFQSWSPDSITSFGNTTVTASYNPTSLIGYNVVDTYGTIDPDDVTIEGPSNVDLKTNDITSNGNITFTYADDTVESIKVVFLTPNGEDKGDNASGNSVVFKQVNNLQNGVLYKVQVIVTKADGKEYSCVFDIKKNI